MTKRTTIICEFEYHTGAVVRVSCLGSGEYIAESRCVSCEEWAEFCRSDKKMAYVVEATPGIANVNAGEVRITPSLDFRRLRKTCSVDCRRWHRNADRKAKQTFKLLETS
jgi:hypothetical protein